MVFGNLCKYHTKILLEFFIDEVEREDIFKLTIGSGNLHEIKIDDGIRILILPHPKI
jgi:hypothetical protein